MNNVEYYLALANLLENMPKEDEDFEEEIIDQMDFTWWDLSPEEINEINASPVYDSTER